MSRYRSELIRIIKHFHLDYRETVWKERLFMAEHGMYSEEFCQSLLYEARLAADAVVDQGNVLWRPPDEDEFYAQGEPDIELGSLIEGMGGLFGAADGTCHPHRPSRKPGRHTRERFFVAKIGGDIVLAVNDSGLTLAGCVAYPPPADGLAHANPAAAARMRMISVTCWRAPRISPV